MLGKANLICRFNTKNFDNSLIKRQYYSLPKILVPKLQKWIQAHGLKWWSACVQHCCKRHAGNIQWPPVSRDPGAYDMCRLQGPKVWLAHEKFLIESSHLWMKMSSANVWQSHLCCWQRTDCFAHSLVLVVGRYWALVQRENFFYIYCKIIMLVQNVFINLINKYLGLLTIELSYIRGPNNIFIYLFILVPIFWIFVFIWAMHLPAKPAQYSNVRHQLASPAMQEIRKKTNI